MYRFAPSALTAALAASALLPFSAVRGQQLSYGLPSRATATYQIVDSTKMVIVGSPMGPLELRSGSSFTYSLTFAADGQGVRVTAELGAFEARLRDPMGTMTSMSQEMAGLTNSFEVVLAPGGLADVMTAPRQAGSELPMLVDPHEVVFPRLPGGSVGTGDTWVDTVNVTVGDGGERVIVYTYTLEGEVIHDGRPHLRVAVSGESTMSMPSLDMTMTLTGTETGHYLWDIEGGLMASSVITRSTEGSATAPDGTAGGLEMTATTRLTLEN
jgi:hypothetical protein